MAITYPRPFPNEPFISCEVEIGEYSTRDEMYGGATGYQEIADPRWQGQWTTRPLQVSEIGIWKAWKDSLKGGKTFLGSDPEQRYPKTYPTGFTGLTRHGGGSFDGTSTSVSSVGANGFTISTLPSTFVIKAGDLVGLIKSGKYGLYRVLEDVTAVAGVATVNVTPRIITSIFGTTPTANFAKPVCEFLLDPTSWSAPRNLEGGTINFRGIQKPF